MAPKELRLPPMMRQKAACGDCCCVYSGKPVWNPEKKRPEVKGKTSIGRLVGDRVIFSPRWLAKHPEFIDVEVRRIGGRYQIIDPEPQPADAAQAAPSRSPAEKAEAAASPEAQEIARLKAEQARKEREILLLRKFARSLNLL